ncbi:hypothetical protein RIF25_15900 [Thermosynechococcaceae cyanobacterium BACA0444]|uniref:TonB-dependent receptor plug domain-containing protein n=1 Tax=Pseudocalidococcus azoricus BACA0444 TaxID=2918990 RepID=A0AAE4FUV0_9CYAN|nr:TonB-dependent receptor plug domain-containing protein [Pseudocalidococcus azoricus]MDS3862283.1 hypothetical protein [Pseudocalidococcus azoricus BACA0444]
MLILGAVAIPFEVALAEVCPVLLPCMIQDGAKISATETEKNMQGYFVPNSSAATGTETPIRDVPFSIQVVPQPVIKDRNVTTLGGALQTVPGVVPLGRQR